MSINTPCGNLETNNKTQARNQRKQQCTEERLSNKLSEIYHSYGDRAESDEDLEEERDVELRREASLEALQAYGGCFVSGFLAMQQPLLRTAPPTKSASSNLSASVTSTDSPRPDSDTLSHMDLREMNERARICRSRRRQTKSRN